MANIQPWKPGDMLREKITGKPFFVVHVYKTGTLISDMSWTGVVAPLLLLPREYKDYALDDEMEYFPVPTLRDGKLRTGWYHMGATW